MVHEVPQPLDDVAAATLPSAMPFSALRSWRLATTLAPQDSNSSMLSSWAGTVSQPSTARSHAPTCTSRTRIRMGSVLDEAPVLYLPKKRLAVAVSGMATASAALSGLWVLALDEDSNCMGGAIGAFFFICSCCVR